MLEFRQLLMLLGLGSSLLSVSLSAQDGATLYQTYCAGCHGMQLEGNSATALIKEDWQYGRSRGQIHRNVRYGIEGTEMAPWGEVLSRDAIDRLVDYIVEAQHQPLADPRPFPQRLNTADYTLRVEVLDESVIRTPWGIAFIDEHQALVTEQPGGLHWLIDGQVDPHPIEGLPKVHAYLSTLGGMMDVAVDPEYEQNRWVYLAYSHTDSVPGAAASPAMTRVIRGKIKDYQWTEEQVLFQVHDSLLLANGTRWGCRFLFDREGYLYFTIGDMDRGEQAQMLSRPNGKIFRIHRDGSIPDDNPFVGAPGALEQIYTLGNRNAQGLALHPITGEIWATEHGPMGGDELNVLRKGANYGWPVITYGRGYDGSVVSPDTARKGMESPITYWTPSIAVCPAAFSAKNQFPKWENNLFVGALAYEEVRRLVLEGKSVVKQEMILKNHGRVRDLTFGPDGALYVLTNKPDAILRITPETQEP